MNLNSQKLNEKVLKNQENDAVDLLALPTKKEIEEMTVGHDESHIQIKFVTADNVTQVRALKIDEHYWPTWHIKKDEGSSLGWKMTFSS
ncbi:hypothetical protein HPULCUR_006192 [Helicostylum pulchrum]|uniref:Uncharacterized protein n=1 Tax=Helicostylum pulchrum TaxID=562976 RepID=A0ABP9Y1E4_9FUNG